ncbi:peptidylprolyl isomerase [Ferviditalea candida]|uniref:Peptidylprolyl isomerase n=1 Tax=Ferviditalea candida TaxID=3108399 RepID=A0ABU5ZNL1_9BACL|nr:peptidylprolyl isomerase [Paenibacillaceae bacterium T2]
MLHSNSKRRGFRWIKGLMIAFLTVSLLTACGQKQASEGQASGKVVATYKGGQVTEDQLNAFLGANKFFNMSPYYGMLESSPTFKKDMLDQYIAFQYLTAGASDEIKKNADQKSEDQMKSLKESINTNADNKKKFEDMLKELKITEKDLQEYMRVRFALSDMLDRKFPDDKLKEQYDKDIQADKQAYVDTATVDHILIALKDQNGKDLRTKEQALARAKEVEAKLKNNGDFAALAKEYSDDPGSKDNGGQYKEANIDSWVPEFRQAALDLPLNQISDPVETQFGYHIMKVEWRNSNKFEDVKSKVRDKLVQAYFSDFMQKDLPGIITKVDLPAETPTPAPSAADAPAKSDGQVKPQETASK